MSNQPIRVLILDDHAMVRKGMKAFLNEYEGICVIGEAADGVEGIRLVEQLKPDIVLIDLLMPGMDGIEAIRRMIAVRPEQRIIVLTAYAKEDKILEAVRAGAMGYLVKDVGADELIQSLYNVHSGIPAYNNMVLWRLLSQKENPEPHQGINELSEREREVLQLLTRGYSDQEIAKQLWLTNVTVRSHISRILSKLGVKNRVQAALYGLRSGFVPLEPPPNLYECSQHPELKKVFYG
jgi:two-component system, NarL family, response regulator LiaR